MARWTQADIDQLKVAIATGTKRVVFQSGSTRREQEFQDLDQMRALLNEMEAEVASTPRVRYATHRKGFYE